MKEGEPFVLLKSRASGLKFREQHVAGFDIAVQDTAGVGVMHGVGVTVVNGYRRRAYEWSQVVAVNLRRGAPWAGMDLSDGTSIPVMAIQGSDGRRAIRAVQELRGVVTEHTRIDRDD